MQVSERAFRYVRVLSIAGSDSGGGAGIQADLKTLSALGVFGMTAITAVTAQNTRGVTAIEGISPEVVRAQVEAVVTDIGVDAVKIGMLHDRAIMRIVAEELRRFRLVPVVLDPVMVASSGAALMAPEARSYMVRELFPLVTLVTPNLDEAGLLVGRSLQSVEDMCMAARELQAMGARAVLLKGGHLQGDHVVDVWCDESGRCIQMSDPRIDTANTHGTGCTLSSAIAGYLALGLEMGDALHEARLYVRRALQAGALVQTGSADNGPLNHGFAPTATRLQRR